MLMLICSVGLSTVEADDPISILSVLGYLLVAAGIIYIVMGLLCLRTVKECKLRDIAGYDLDDERYDDGFLPPPRVPKTKMSAGGVPAPPPPRVPTPGVPESSADMV